MDINPWPLLQWRLGCGAMTLVSAENGCLSIISRASLSVTILQSVFMTSANSNRTNQKNKHLKGNRNKHQGSSTSMNSWIVCQVETTNSGSLWFWKVWLTESLSVLRAVTNLEKCASRASVWLSIQSPQLCRRRLAAGVMCLSCRRDPRYTSSEISLKIT